jgi:KaiC/GvpD/RAD55 family RecA-like ATPase
LARQICWNLLQEGAKVLYYAIDHAAEELRYDMSSHGWDVKAFEETGKLRIVDLFSDASTKMDTYLKKGFDEKETISTSFQAGLYSLGLIYKEGIRFLPLTTLAQIPRIVVLDSLSPLLSTKQEETFRFLHTLKFATRIAKATGIGIIHKGVHEKSIEDTVKSLADGIIELSRSNDPFSESSLLEITRYSGEYKQGPFPIEVESTGVKVIPISLPNLFRTSKST